MSGVIATEYAAHVTEVPTASRSPIRSPEKPPPAPPATSPTPTNEIAAAIQNVRVGRSRPTKLARIPMKIGVMPSTSATVDAFVSFTEYTNPSWFRKIAPAAIEISRESRRETRKLRSCDQVNAQKSAVAAK